MDDIVKSIPKDTRLQKYLDHLNPDIENKPRLGKVEKEYFELMKVAYHWRSTFFSPDQVRKMLQKEGNGRGYSSACQIYADMEYVYGKTAEVNKEALKRIQIESYYKLIQMIYKSNADDWEKAKRIESILDKISNLYGLKDGDTLDINTIMPARVVQIVAGNVQVANLEGGGGS